MIEIGRVCVKLAGREAGKQCVIVEIVDDNYVVIDGDVKRRKCNLDHLEPTSQKLDISSKAAHPAVIKAFSAAGFKVTEKKEPRQAGPRPVKVRKSAKKEGESPAKEAVAKKATKKADAKKPAKEPKAKKA